MCDDANLSDNNDLTKDIEGLEHETVTFGFTCTLNAVSSATWIMRSLVHKLVTYVKQMMVRAGYIVPFSTLEINKCPGDALPIIRGHGKCACLPLGRFSGGELMHGGKYYNLVNARILIYDSSVPHAHAYYRGTKYTITAFWHHMATFTNELLALGMSTESSVPRGIGRTINIEIVSRDLCAQHTHVQFANGIIELPYKKQGVWALHVSDNLEIIDKSLLDTYFSAEYEFPNWGSVIYTVSDTACAMSRPMCMKFYEHFAKKGIKLPQIEYRVPFVIVCSNILGNLFCMGSRWEPFVVHITSVGMYTTTWASRQYVTTSHRIDFD